MGPVRLAILVAGLVLLLGFVLDQPCRIDGWADRSDRSMWTSLCYSDVAFLYRERGFVDDQVAYRDTWLEYPVLTGLIMQLSAVAAKALSGWPSGLPGGLTDPALAEGVRFYDVTTVAMALAAFVTIVATARTVRRRPWDGMLVAASPLLLLGATVNWDLLAVALASLAVLAWTRDRPFVAGVLVGLGAAAKLYPMLLLGPMLLVAMRSPDRRSAMRRFAVTLASAVLGWAAVNVPVARWAPDGWSAFFEFNADRGAEFGSSWQALRTFVPGVVPEDLNLLVVVGAAVLLALIVSLAFVAAEPPRLAQLAFLAVAAFLLVNKVWSPQYALWLLPLVVLARPRVRELAIWQAAEVGYFVAVWWHLAGLFDPERQLISEQGYAVAIAVRIAALLWVAGVVVRDILQPRYDPVRQYVDDGEGAHRS